MIRFGVAGFGLHAVRRLLPGFAQAQACQVVALSRRDRVKGAQSAVQYGIQHVFTSTEELCRCPDVDAVFVTSPNACHFADVLAAIAARKPVLCEKPMGMNAAECQQMVEAARRAGVLLGVAQIFRFEQTTAEFRRKIAEDAIGRPVLARAEFCYPGLQHPRKWLYDRSLAGGGPIADVGVHCIDALRYILQDEPIEVSAFGRSDERSRDVEASAVLNLRFRRGTLATVLVSTRAAYRTPLEFVGESGVLRADDGLSVDKEVTVELWRDGRQISQERFSNRSAYGLQVDSFARAIEGKTAFPAPGEQGWQNQIILDAAYGSMVLGRTESIQILDCLQ
jgi:1,5-anhydro-D-fructose reductase (1,5-anhydro-D-mannitol-forming)